MLNIVAWYEDGKALAEMTVQSKPLTYFQYPHFDINTNSLHDLGLDFEKSSIKVYLPNCNAWSKISSILYTMDVTGIKNVLLRTSTVKQLTGVDNYINLM
ncbi:hypothetical protein H1R20_g10711, partial [Candolleomyces eurysporus]